MTLNDEQYERVARRLDGQDIQLSSEEQALAEAMRAQEQYLDSVLPVPVPAEVLRRVDRRLTAALARPRHRVRWIGVAAATAAAVVIAVLVQVFLNHQDKPRPDPLAGVPTEKLFEVSSTNGNGELTELSKEIDKLEAETFVSVFSSADESLFESLEREIEQTAPKDSSSSGADEG